MPKDSLQQNQQRLLRNGKFTEAERQEALFLAEPLDSLPLPIFDQKLIAALEDQLDLLSQPRFRSSRRVGNLTIYRHDLEETVKILQYWQQTLPLYLGDYLEARRIWGEDRKGNVRFTAYFTPVLSVRRRPTGKYKYPIYARPLNWSGPLPTRAQIEGGGVLAEQGLELAYAANKVDIYYMQVQGSGYVEYPDGSRELFSYNGTNRKPYHSIEKYIAGRPELGLRNLSIDGIRSFLQRHPELTDTILFQNPSYTFFYRKKSRPTGAGAVPLHPDISIAVDPKYLPLGSCLLAAVPVFDRKQQRVTGHEYRILLAQDVGGAIRGPGHVDLYFGTGPEAQHRATRFKHYGRLWLLLPRQPFQVVTTGGR